MGHLDLDLHTGYTSIAEIDIDALPAGIWRYVLQPDAWVHDFHFERIAGQAGEEGETWDIWPDGAEMPGGVATVAPEDRTEDRALRLKVLTLVPERLWYAVNTPKTEADGSRTTGVNLVTLTELGDRTRVTAVRGKEVVSATAAERDAVHRELQILQPIPQARWVGKYLPRLKALAESDR